MTVHPSGEQFEIRSGDTVATVGEVGGGLRDLRAGDRRLVDGYAADEACDGARGQLLLPWPNRIKDGRYRGHGEERQLPLTEPERHTAIHGLARWANWVCAKRTNTSVTMTYRLPPQSGWAWVLDLMAEYVVADGELTVRMTATNRSGSPAPFAAGAHPYLAAVGSERIDDGILHLPARTYLRTDEQQIPTGVEPVDGTPYDFQLPRRLGAVQIDHAYGDLERGADGMFRARLLAADESAGTEIWLDGSYRYLEVFTGDALPRAAERRKGLALEPMTAPPNAFGSGTDVISLDPGGTWTGAWGIRAL